MTLQFNVTANHSFLSDPNSHLEDIGSNTNDRLSISNSSRNYLRMDLNFAFLHNFDDIQREVVSFARH